jgi:hypothetical protein
VKGPWYSLEHTFKIEPGVAKLPRPPITDKLRGERPRSSGSSRLEKRAARSLSGVLDCPGGGHDADIGRRS